MSKYFDPSNAIQDFLVFGEFGDVNPSITDSSTFTFMSPDRMEELFDHEIEGCFLYSRHWNPTNKFLSDALARMEDSEAAQAKASGMAAISSAIIQLCGNGDEIISSRTVYGGTYALFKNFLPRFGIKVHFVDVLDLDAIAALINENTKVIYCESISNPLLDVSDIPSLSKLCKSHGIKLVVDNTFSPMMLSPIRLGADVVVHSLTKYINGTSDCVAGCVCASNDFIHQLTDINSGASMLFGAVLDSTRAASILKNLHSLHLRMRQHSRNAQFIAENLQELGLKVFYPGLPDHPHHQLLTEMMNDGFGYGGMLAIDVGDAATANRLMTRMQEEKVGYLAVSLGYFKTLFSSPGHSTSSEIPIEERQAMGLSEGLVRFSIGLDNDIQLSFERIKSCLKELGIV
ncbi:MAG TPA: aminotransferase class I/II-fold pyridoxal phosphate-dependent enzyme [Pyrinomonadaceae bacterium]|nr:aminotransferase class I/II-fold pyridoxal phosphate-dependent enzyme [Chloracidobacterium sp.]MBP9936755.1 aminotransferase class I/II-fold pyridoxal phosphate-dependent enzyme [Pyrinomonadaceae bacterium]MBK7801878.1 aminotransferase class I/II-fold pyridoxal phosphate-dependent enzyme [Chloracidobacterium sp.]MBK9437977.1 aminotransferase class I/II-fold pyridoxal phosphate-dependent enzyme [Chloracidobacterium sp.]MBL0242184.1 aminotransferase class I/II-fold pyridoxal phosphate-dependen